MSIERGSILAIDSNRKTPLQPTKEYRANSELGEAISFLLLAKVKEIRSLGFTTSFPFRARKRQWNGSILPTSLLVFDLFARIV